MSSIPKFGDIAAMQSLNHIISNFQTEIIVCTKQLKDAKGVNGIIRIQILHISANLKQRRSDVDEILKYIKNNDSKIEQKIQRPVFCENWLLSNVVMLGVGDASNKLGTALLSNRDYA